MSYNALGIAAELGIERVVMASSVNSVGMRKYLPFFPSSLSTFDLVLFPSYPLTVSPTCSPALFPSFSLPRLLGIRNTPITSADSIVFSKQPRFDYLPMDEDHPCYPEDAYSLAKQLVSVLPSPSPNLGPDFHALTTLAILSSIYAFSTSVLSMSVYLAQILRQHHASYLPTALTPQNI